MKDQNISISKTTVNKAGKNVREKSESCEDMEIIEEWRVAHRAVLNTFQASLRNRTKRSSIIVAQRHKRRNTIFNKLLRHPKMELARMDDIAGCRLIFETIDDLNEFRTSFHKARFKHRRRNEVDKYNYIKFPKDTGYRGFDDVYSYDVNSSNGEKYKGLFVEIQYRTLAQHAWATAVEVIGFITESQPKFQQGDKRYEICMAFASEIIARGHENLKGAYPEFSDDKILQEFEDLESELHIIRTLTGLNVATTDSTDNRNIILIFHPNGRLESRNYRESSDAFKALFQLEKDLPELDIVLVKADSDREIKITFKNYFSDAKDFINILSKSVNTLKTRDYLNK